MPVTIRLPNIHPEDALSHFRRWLRRQLERRRSRSAGRLQFSLYSVIDEVLEQEQRRHRGENPNGMIMYVRDPLPNSDSFQDAAWELVARGVIRPALTRPDGHQTVFTGTEFVVTEYGERWVAEASPVDVIPSESGRFGSILASYRELFGEAYHARAQEAMQCYQAHAYLACCTMCGAAAEAILLSLAIERTQDQRAVLNAYRGGAGRSRVERILSNQQNNVVRDQLEEFGALIKYWRDDAAHAVRSRLTEQEAFMALLLLLRLATFAHERWAEITSPTAGAS